MNPDSFLQLADSIKDNGAAGARSATSRAYYSVFHSTLATLNKVGVALSQSANSHTHAIHCLLNLPSENAKSAGSLLGDLHGQRIRADYRLQDSKPDASGVAKLAVEQAKKLQMFLMLLSQEIDSAQESRDKLRKALVGYCEFRGVRYSEVK